MTSSIPRAYLLARGPWAPECVRATWREERYEPEPAGAAAADEAIAALADRGSPSHDGWAARMAAFTDEDGELRLELQPARWALRLVPDHAAGSLSALCVVRDADGRWLAGRRAPWLASWSERWALGAGGSVEVGEDPTHTLVRELEEEWSVAPERLSVEALVGMPSGLVLLVGLAWLPAGAEVVRDDEHDEHAWWPAAVADWPPEGDDPLRRVAGLLTQGQ
jgi:ADP-ribose pyrophosphatase YjhB (NUDIX family)